MEMISLGEVARPSYLLPTKARLIIHKLKVYWTYLEDLNCSRSVSRIGFRFLTLCALHNVIYIPRPLVEISPE